MHITTFKKILSAALATLLVSWSLAGAALEVGDKAPDFKLQASDGKTYQLSDLIGRQAVVIAWYPFAFTSGCTIECKSLAENGHLLKRLHSKVKLHCQ